MEDLQNGRKDEVREYWKDKLRTEIKGLNYKSHTNYHSTHLRC